MVRESLAEKSDTRVLPLKKGGTQSHSIQGDSIPGRGLCAWVGVCEVCKETSVTSGEGARGRGVRLEVREVTRAGGGESRGAIGAFRTEEQRSGIPGDSRLNRGGAETSGCCSHPSDSGWWPRLSSGVEEGRSGKIVHII